ncbi:hypothetical protein LXL04_027399 [Taraxacum kok-saghyz]
MGVNLFPKGPHKEDAVRFKRPIPAITGAVKIEKIINVDTQFFEILIQPAYDTPCGRPTLRRKSSAKTAIITIQQYLQNSFAIKHVGVFSKKEALLNFLSAIKKKTRPANVAYIFKIKDVAYLIPVGVIKNEDNSTIRMQLPSLIWLHTYTRPQNYVIIENNEEYGKKRKLSVKKDFKMRRYDAKL